MDHHAHPTARAAALRWRVLAVDDALLALEYADAQLHVQVLDVDTASRLVRSGTRERLAFPVAMPDDAEWIAASRVLETNLAVPLTLLVFRAAAAEENGDPSRPAKRARRDTTPTPPPTATRLFFFSLWHGDAWELAPLGEVRLPATDLSVHVTDGPCVVAHSPSSGELSLLRPAPTDRGECSFEVVCSRLQLPARRRSDCVETLLSCQLVDSSTTSTPHLLLQYTRTDEQTPSDEGSATAWRSSEAHRFWATLALDDHSSGVHSAAISPCSYLPAKWLEDDSRTASESITSCAFVGRDSPAGRPLQLLPSVIVVLGTSSGVLYFMSNDVPLASYVLTGAPLSIQVINAHNTYGSSATASHLVAAVQCADADRTFQLLSIDCGGHRGRVVRPMQHFTYVGSALSLPVSHLGTDASLILLNDVDFSSGDAFLEQSLRKSVLVQAEWVASPQVSSSCHRLKYRSDEKKSKKKKEPEGNESVRCIERVKIDRWDHDLGDGDRKSAPSSSASDQQLSMLARSLEERLRIGREEHERLERVSADKMKTLAQVNKLLRDRQWGPEYSHFSSPHTDCLELAPLVRGASSPATTSTNISRHSEDSSSLEETNSTTAPVLEDFAIQSYENATSALRLRITVRVPYTRPALDGDDQDVNPSMRYISVVPLSSAGPVIALRSSSTILEDHRPDNIGLPSFRLHFNVSVELPPQLIATRHHASLGLWLCTEQPEQNGDLSSSTTLSEPLGRVEIDSTILTAASTTIHTTRDFTSQGVSGNESTGHGSQGQLLLLSGGSSLRDVLHSLKSSVPTVPFSIGITRQQFASVHLHTCSPTELYSNTLSLLLRALPSDVMAIVNPLIPTSISSVLQLIHLMQTELLQLQMLESRGSGGETKTSKAHSLLLQTQAKTDLQAVRVLNELQRRMNFHTRWGSANASSLTSSTHA